MMSSSSNASDGASSKAGKKKKNKQAKEQAQQTVQPSPASESSSSATASSPSSSSDNAMPSSTSADQSELIATDEQKSTAISEEVDLSSYDSTTTTLLEFIVSILDGDIATLTLSPQQASIVRYLVIKKDDIVVKLLTQLQSDMKQVIKNDAAAASRITTAFHNALSPIITKHIETEASCYELQQSELEALQSIFSSSHELMLYETVPITLKLIVALQEFHCNVELGFAMTPLYPMCEPIQVTAFIPPPYQGLKIGSDATTSATVDSLLQAALESKARELASTGDSSIYSCLEEARSFMESHAVLLQSSVEQREAEMALQSLRVGDAASTSVSSSSSSGSASTSSLSSSTPLITVFGRGRIEHLEYAAIQRVQQSCDLNESMAKAKLIAMRWNVEEVIQKQGGMSKESMKDADSLELPPISAKPTTARQLSIQQRADAERFASLLAHYSSARTDPSLELTCSACFDLFQLREVSGHKCGHIMCHSCWRRMLVTELQQGRTTLKCPGHKCVENVEEGLLMTLLPPQYYQRYRRYLQDSFIQLKGWKWCVNRRCNNVASSSSTVTPITAAATTNSALPSSSSSSSFQTVLPPLPPPSGVVVCSCHSIWCYSCQRKGHWPLSCDTLSSYDSSPLVLHLRKNVQSRVKDKASTVEEESALSGLRLKRCPSCGLTWEKNGGCNHFTCTCRFQFCWLCTKPWSSHSQSVCSGESGEGRPIEKLTFLTTKHIVQAAGDFDEIITQCEMERSQWLAIERVQELLKEIDEIKSASTSSSSSASSSKSSSTQSDLGSLLLELSSPPLIHLESVLTSLLEAHLILRSVFIYLILFWKTFHSDPPPPPNVLASHIAATATTTTTSAAAANTTSSSLPITFSPSTIPKNSTIFTKTTVITHTPAPGTIAATTPAATTAPATTKQPATTTSLFPHPIPPSVIKQMSTTLDQVEYFVDSLDATLIPASRTKRSLRTPGQIDGTLSALRKYARELDSVFRTFQVAAAKCMSEAQALQMFLDTTSSKEFLSQHVDQKGGKGTTTVAAAVTMISPGKPL